MTDPNRTDLELPEDAEARRDAMFSADEFDDPESPWYDDSPWVPVPAALGGKPFSGWQLDPDPLSVPEPETAPRRRFGCAWLPLLLLALAVGA